jgi:DNA-binding GntR family transcriptional regulator
VQRKTLTSGAAADPAASTKADDVALELEQAIVSGEIPPGTVLRQEQLSERYGVSRTPIREALRRLAALGLVSFEPNRGVRVRTLTRAELREAFLIRAELESLATEIAAERMTRADLDELEAIETRFSSLTDELRRGGGHGVERRADLVAEWVRANHSFHDVIYRVASLPMVERLAKGARYSGSAVWAPADASELDELYSANERQHRALLDALAAGSPSGARALAREHVLSSGALLERILGQQLGSE